MDEKEITEKLIYVYLSISLNDLNMDYNETEKIVLKQFDDCKQERHEVKKEIRRIYLEEFKNQVK